MRYDTAFFDLDGTVTDSAPGILASVRHAISKWRGESGEESREYSDAELNFFIGPPLVDSFEKLLGCPREEALKCLGYYRERFEPIGLYENSVYPGVPELLKALRGAGVRTVLATAKPELFARRILDHFGLTGLFDAIHGATMDEGRNTKTAVISWALGHSGEVGRVVMVGDRADDVKGAAANGLPPIGVLWGYGSETELAAAGAREFASTPDVLRKMILG